MRVRWITASAVAVMAIGIGVAGAAHAPEIDPAAVPVGFLATHNDVANFAIHPFARAVNKHHADVFVQHARIPPNGATIWHTHPGPAIVTVVRGTLTYQDEHGNRCQTATYGPKQGFVDPGFGHVHRAIAGPAGADFYVTYVLPSGSETHIIPTDPPAACS